MKKLNYLGIGPKIGIPVIPWLAITIIISLKYSELFSIIPGGSKILFYTGLLIVTSGLVLYFTTLPLLLKGVKETKLITYGAFSICRNPLYAAFILFILPGTSLLVNSWLSLTSCILAFFLFKRFIKSEYSEMEKFFGDDFKKYYSETPELFPISVKKWLKKGEEADKK